MLRQALQVQAGRYQHDRSPLAHQRQRLLHGEVNAAGVDAKRLVEMVRRHILSERAFDKAGAGNDDIESAFFIPHPAIETIKIVEIGDIGLDGSHVPTDLGLRLVEFALTAADDENVGALRHELLRGREADAARTTGDDGDFSIEF